MVSPRTKYIPLHKHQQENNNIFCALLKPKTNNINPYIFRRFLVLEELICIRNF